MKHKWRFIQSLVEDAPDTRGIYILWEDEKLICVGRADGTYGNTIRSQLLAHLRGETGAESQHATHYGWEICRDPMAREAALLHEFRSLDARVNAPAPEILPPSGGVH